MRLLSASLVACLLTEIVRCSTSRSSPPQGYQLTFPDSADQLQIEHGQGVSPFGCIQVGFQILRLQCLHLLMLDLRHHAAVGGVSDQQSLFHCPVQGTVKHDVDAPYRGAAEAWAFLPLHFPQPPILKKVLVQLLDLPAGELVELDGSNPGDGVFLHGPAVIASRRGADVEFGVELKPQPQPLHHRVFSGAGHVQLLALCDRYGQLGFYFRLGSAQHVFDDPFAVLVVPSGVPAFPAAILSLSDVTLSVGSPFCHYLPLLCWRASQARCSSSSSKEWREPALLQFPGRV